MQMLHSGNVYANIVHTQHRLTLGSTEANTSESQVAYSAEEKRDLDFIGRALNWGAEVLEDAAARRIQYTIFRNTFHELNALSDRELADLGLARSDIKRVAQDAAYRRR